MKRWGGNTKKGNFIAGRADVSSNVFLGLFNVLVFVLSISDVLFVMLKLTLTRKKEKWMCNVFPYDFILL